MNHPFQVSKVYQNRLGHYEVVSFNGQDEMIIRYLDSGEERVVSIEAQARIWQNMSWEEQARAQEQEAIEARFQQGYGEDFTGLVDSDFKNNTEGTTWRSRRGLAGSVAQYLSADTPYTFVSWAIYRWPVAFLTHRADYEMAAYEMGSRKAKFTVELDENNLYYGLYLERSDEQMDKTWDWTRLLPPLQESQVLQEVIMKAELESGLRFIGRAYQGEDTFHFADGPGKGARALWPEETPTNLSVAERLGRLAQIPQGHWVEIYIMGTMAKDDAVAEGVQIAQQIAADMRILLPLYTAATQE